MTLKPIGKRFIVQYKKVEPKKGALILTTEEPNQFATLIRIGCGSDFAIDLKEGDLVVLAKYAGLPVKVENELFLVVEEKDIVAKLEKENAP